MSEIDPLEIPALLLRMVPETAEHIAELYEMPAERAVISEAARYDTFVLLDEEFSRPVVQSELRKAPPDGELTGKCFEFVDVLVRSSNQALSGPVYFQGPGGTPGRGGVPPEAIPFMWEATRKATARMLTSYKNPVPDALLR
ncbi:hypothetical protein [Streptomyces pinistramenti]|uniref:hypothetical protein n=1 Tax=Streptomyces pinistramenti TaxID=2884812 RepID=UPI001D09225C|nr:hypothetical protein [Streptomyces pinistramenti]MCB5907379.1 hypothetical protein [Streptomyces pinistramenti]